MLWIRWGLEKLAPLKFCVSGISFLHITLVIRCESIYIITEITLISMVIVKYYYIHFSVWSDPVSHFFSLKSVLKQKMLINFSARWRLVSYFGVNKDTSWWLFRNWRVGYGRCYQGNTGGSQCWRGSDFSLCSIGYSFNWPSKQESCISFLFFLFFVNHLCN